MRDVVIVGHLRTAQSWCRPRDPRRDRFHKLRADDLLARLLPEAIKRTGVKTEEIEDFIVGSAMGVNEQWSYGGRCGLANGCVGGGQGVAMIIEREAS